VINFFEFWAVSMLHQKISLEDTFMHKRCLKSLAYRAATQHVFRHSRNSIIPQFTTLYSAYKFSLTTSGLQSQH